MKIGDLVKYNEDEIKSIVDYDCLYHLYERRGLVIGYMNEPPCTPLYQVLWFGDKTEWIVETGLEVI